MIGVWGPKKLCLAVIVSPNRWLWQENNTDDQVTRILGVAVLVQALWPIEAVSPIPTPLVRVFVIQGLKVNIGC